MPRTSAFQSYLDKLPEAKRLEMESIARTAPSATEAVKQLKRRGCRCSYDSVLSWRNSQKRARAEATPQRIESTPQPEKDPIQQVRDLSIRLNALSAKLITLVENHEWIEENEVRLSQRQAEKLIAGIPSMVRTSVAGIIESSRLQLARNEKELCQSMLYEFGEDWRRTLEHDNPELLGMFESVAAVTRSRAGSQLQSTRSLVMQGQR